MLGVDTPYHENTNVRAFGTTRLMHVNPEYGKIQNYDAKVVEYEDAPDECTIHPIDPDESQQRTVWLTAQEGSYVPASAMR